MSTTVPPPGAAPRPAAGGRAWASVAFLLGIAVSVAANVAHTYYPSPATLKASGVPADQWRPEIGAQAMSAFYPLALLLVVEVLSRAPWPRSLGWSAARYGGASVVAGVAAVVSYRHMAALLGAYGEDQLTTRIGPLAVDGLMVVASFALLAIGKTRRDHPAEPATQHQGRGGTVLQTVRAWWHRTEPTGQNTAPDGSAQHDKTAPVAVPDRPAPGPVPVPKTNGKTVPARSGGRSRTGKAAAKQAARRAVPDVDELMPLGWRIAADMNARGVPLKRDTLRAELRNAGQPVGSEKVGALLARLKTEAPTDPTTTPTGENTEPVEPAEPADEGAAPAAAKGDQNR